MQLCFAGFCILAVVTALVTSIIPSVNSHRQARESIQRSNAVLYEHARHVAEFAANQAALAEIGEGLGVLNADQVMPVLDEILGLPYEYSLLRLQLMVREPDVHVLEMAGFSALIHTHLQATYLGTKQDALRFVYTVASAGLMVSRVQWSYSSERLVMEKSILGLQY